MNHTVASGTESKWLTPFKCQESPSWVGLLKCGKTQEPYPTLICPSGFDPPLFGPRSAALRPRHSLPPQIALPKSAYEAHYLWNKQCTWPSGSADTECPRRPVITQVQHFVSRLKKRQRWDVQTMWAYDLDLGPWRSWRLPLMLLYVLHPHTNFEMLRLYCS